MNLHLMKTHLTTKQTSSWPASVGGRPPTVWVFWENMGITGLDKTMQLDMVGKCWRVARNKLRFTECFNSAQFLYCYRINTEIVHTSRDPPTLLFFHTVTQMISFPFFLLDPLIKSYIYSSDLIWTSAIHCTLIKFVLGGRFKESELFSQ